jgi:DNA (cytosine-5)-methyltransferase 1
MGDRNPNSLNYVSLFSGAMGLDIGLERAGFKCVLANEVDKLAVETIRLNRPKVPVFDNSIEFLNKNVVQKLSKKRSSEIDLVAGGPPCQAFSVFGQRKGIYDGRGKLLFEFHRIVDEIKPKFFLMENVRGLHSIPLVPKNVDTNLIEGFDESHTKPGSLLNELIRLFCRSGYYVNCFLVNSVNYGAPQIRERLLIIGNRLNYEVTFPQPLFSNRPEDNLPPFKTLGDVISNGFNDNDPDCLNFSPRKLKYLNMVPPGGNWRSLPIDIQKESMGKSWYLKGGRSAYWRKLSFDFPCPTVVTMPNHAGTSMCHPTELRALTVGEMAAVQEFPKNWRFVGTPMDKCRQIGNAVPPRLGEVAGKAIKDAFKKKRLSKFTQNKPSDCEITHIRPHVRTRSYFEDGETQTDVIGYYSKKAQKEKDQLRFEFATN